MVLQPYKGTLISPDHVLTTARCCSVESDYLSLKIGVKNVRAKGGKIHPKWKNKGKDGYSFNWDYCLLTLEKSEKLIAGKTDIACLGNDLSNAGFRTILI